MAKRNVYHVVPGKKGWDVKKEGNQRASKNTNTKKDAVDWSREKAKSEKPAQVKIHKNDGSIQTEHTYGKDPEKYPG